MYTAIVLVTTISSVYYTNFFLSYSWSLNNNLFRASVHTSTPVRFPIVRVRVPTGLGLVMHELRPIVSKYHIKEIREQHFTISPPIIQNKMERLIKNFANLGSRRPLSIFCIILIWYEYFLLVLNFTWLYEYCVFDIKRRTILCTGSRVSQKSKSMSF